jgi:hypothetical protein
MTAPGVYLGDQTQVVDPDDPDPVPTPTPSNTTDPDTPAPDPTPVVINGTESSGNSKGVNILVISGEIIMLMCLIAILLFLCVNKLDCCKKKQTYDELPEQNNSAFA